MKNIGQKFFDETCWVENVIYLPGAVGDGTVADGLIEFFKYNDDEFIEKAIGELPLFMKDGNVEDVGDMDRSELSDFISEYVYRSSKKGFLVLFATPVFSEVTEQSATFFWGYYSTQWVYGDTFEQALEKGFEWVELRRKQEREHAGIKEQTCP